MRAHERADDIRTVPLGRRLALSCSGPDESDLVLTGGSYSPGFFRLDGASVSSSAVVWQTPEQAQADWDRNIQPALMGCLAAELQASAPKKIKVIVTNRRQLAWPAIAPRTAPTGSRCS